MIKYTCDNCPSNCVVIMEGTGPEVKPHQCIYNWDNDCDVEWVKVIQGE